MSPSTRNRSSPPAPAAAPARFSVVTTPTAEARLAQLGWETYANWNERVGGSCGYVPWPVIVTVATEGVSSNVDLMRQNIAMQNRLGIDSRLITAAELQELQPYSYVGDVDYVSYEPDSGYVDSVQATQSMISRDASGRHRPRRERGHRHPDGRWSATGLLTSAGDFPADVVVCAAGPWWTRIMATARVEIPISTIRVQIIIAQRPIELVEPHFIYLDTVAGIFSRPWAPGSSLIGVAAGVARRGRSQRRHLFNDHAYPDLAIEAISQRIPAMKKTLPTVTLASTT
ncbi:MAG: FAD-dependent oxidoreductase [Thermomicrobiales bacterium]